MQTDQPTSVLSRITSKATKTAIRQQLPLKKHRPFTGQGTRETDKDDTVSLKKMAKANWRAKTLKGIPRSAAWDSAEIPSWYASTTSIVWELMVVSLLVFWSIHYRTYAYDIYPYVTLQWVDACFNEGKYCIHRGDGWLMTSKLWWRYNLSRTLTVHDRFNVFDSIDPGRYKTGRAFVCIAVNQ